MTEKLRISDDLSLPIEAVTETLAMIGRRGSGKSYASHKLAEEMHRCDAQFVALDPVGIWYGLRLAADGKRPGLPIPVLGGLHGDIPLEATGGALIADLVVDRGASVILDVSQFESDPDKARFARAFADRFFFRKKASPSAVHLFIEECQEFVPQNPQKGEELMLHAFTRMAKIGRNFGIGMSFISQRPQEVNKKVLNLTELLFAFQLTGTHERTSVQKWIEDKDIDEDIAGELPKLERGEPHVWSPAWLKISRRVKIARKNTFDASSTPKVGKAAISRDLSPIDLDQLRIDMAATIEKAKADDPKRLKAELAAARAELAKLARKPPVKAGSATTAPPDRATAKRVSQLQSALESAMKFIVNITAQDFIGKAGEVDQERLQKAIVAAVGQATAQLDGKLDTQRKAFERWRNDGDRLLKGIRQLLAKGEVMVDLTVRHNEPFTVSRAPAPSRDAPMPRDAPQSPSTGHDLTAARQKILDKLAWLESMDLSPAPKETLAAVCGVRPTSGGYFNNLGALRSAGLIDYPGAGVIAFTDAGRAGAAPVQDDGRQVHEHWLEVVDAPQRKILERLIELHPKQVSKDELARDIGVSETSGGYFNNLGRLRTLGAIDYPQKGFVGLTRYVMP